MRKGFKTWAERQAADHRRALSLLSTSPLDAVRLAKHLDIAVLGPVDIPGLSAGHRDHLLKDGSSSWSAVTLDTAIGRLIIHNTTHSPERQQSNLMHEIAHVICKHEPMKMLPIVGGSIMLRDYDHEAEEEAAWLGACLQLPREALCWALRRRMPETAIAEHFLASIEQVRYRIQITGVTRQFAGRFTRR